MSEIANPFGFSMTLPQSRKISCSYPDGTPHEQQQLDMDWTCTFNAPGVEGHVYIRNHAESCQVLGLGPTPVFRAAGAFGPIDGAASVTDHGHRNANTFRG